MTATKSSTRKQQRKTKEGKLGAVEVKDDQALDVEVADSNSKKAEGGKAAETEVIHYINRLQILYFHLFFFFT